MIGDIVGKPGRSFLANHLSKIIADHKIDFIIANGENSAGGFGITSKIAQHFFNIGIDVITTGNHVWKNKDVLNIIETEKRILRPLNYPEGVPGIGYGIYTKNGVKVLVVNLLGRINLLEVDCPFQKIDQFLNKTDSSKYDIAVIDFHAETTSEKIAMGWFLDGRVGAVLGTHTHVQTSDERILDHNTAYITDVGMTGGFNSVLGIEKDKIISFFLTRMPIKFKLATDHVGMNAVIVDFDKETHQPLSIQRFNLL